MRFEEESRLHDHIAAVARKRGWPSVARVAAGKRVVKLHLAFRICQDLGRLRFGPALKKWDFLYGLLRGPGNKMAPSGIPSVSPHRAPPCAT